MAGERTEYTYDVRNRQVSKKQFTTNTKALTTQTAYDNQDRAVTDTDPYGRRTFRVYDETGQVVREVRELVPNAVPSGSSVATLVRVSTGNPPYVIEDTQYDPMGPLLAKIDERGSKTTWAYDARGRAIEKVEAAGTTVARTTRYEYDAAGNQTKVIHPRQFKEAGTFQTVTTFGGQDRISSVTRGAGTSAAATTSYTYSLTGRVTTQTIPQGGVATNSYDVNDRIQSFKDQAAFTTTRTYDGAGRSSPRPTRWARPRPRRTTGVAGADQQERGGGNHQVPVRRQADRRDWPRLHLRHPDLAAGLRHERRRKRGAQHKSRR